MSSPALHLVIDARPRGPRGLLATEILLGRPVLSHLVEQALTVGSPGGPIAVHAREDEHALLQGLMANHVSNRVMFFMGPPQAGAAIMRTDRLYDLRRLRRAVRSGGDPETAVIWRLDRASSLATAEEELKRRLTYQPLGRFWAFALAERLAATLAATGARPNHLTLGAAALMLTASAIVAFGGPGYLPSIATALALAAALVLDTADGRLARLQGTRLGIRPLAGPGARRACRRGSARCDCLVGLPVQPAASLAGHRHALPRRQVCVRDPVAHRPCV